MSFEKSRTYYHKGRNGLGHRFYKYISSCKRRRDSGGGQASSMISNHGTIQDHQKTSLEPVLHASVGDLEIGDKNSSSLHSQATRDVPAPQLVHGFNGRWRIQDTCQEPVPHASVGDLEISNKHSSSLHNQATRDVPAPRLVLHGLNGQWSVQDPCQEPVPHASDGDLEQMQTHSVLQKSQARHNLPVVQSIDCGLNSSTRLQQPASTCTPTLQPASKCTSTLQTIDCGLDIPSTTNSRRLPQLKGHAAAGLTFGCITTAARDLSPAMSHDRSYSRQDSETVTQSTTESFWGSEITQTDATSDIFRTHHGAAGSADKSHLPAWTRLGECLKGIISATKHCFRADAKPFRPKSHALGEARGPAINFTDRPTRQPNSVAQQEGLDMPLAEYARQSEVKGRIHNRGNSPRRASPTHTNSTRPHASNQHQSSRSSSSNKRHRSKGTRERGARRHLHYEAWQRERHQQGDSATDTNEVHNEANISAGEQRERIQADDSTVPHLDPLVHRLAGNFQHMLEQTAEKQIAAMMPAMEVAVATAMQVAIGNFGATPQPAREQEPQLDNRHRHPSPPRDRPARARSHSPQRGPIAKHPKKRHQSSSGPAERARSRSPSRQREHKKGSHRPPPACKPPHRGGHRRDSPDRNDRSHGRHSRSQRHSRPVHEQRGGTGRRERTPSSRSTPHNKRCDDTRRRSLTPRSSSPRCRAPTPELGSLPLLSVSKPSGSNCTPHAAAQSRKNAAKDLQTREAEALRKMEHAEHMLADCRQQLTWPSVTGIERTALLAKAQLYEDRITHLDRQVHLCRLGEAEAPRAAQQTAIAAQPAQSGVTTPACATAVGEGCRKTRRPKKKRESARRTVTRRRSRLLARRHARVAAALAHHTQQAGKLRASLADAINALAAQRIGHVRRALIAVQSSVTRARRLWMQRRWPGWRPHQVPDPRGARRDSAEEQTRRDTHRRQQDQRQRARLQTAASQRIERQKQQLDQLRAEHDTMTQKLQHGGKSATAMRVPNWLVKGLRKALSKGGWRTVPGATPAGPISEAAGTQNGQPDDLGAAVEGQDRQLDASLVGAAANAPSARLDHAGPVHVPEFQTWLGSAQGTAANDAATQGNPPQLHMSARSERNADTGAQQPPEDAMRRLDFGHAGSSNTFGSPIAAQRRQPTSAGEGLLNAPAPCISDTWLDRTPAADYANAPTVEAGLLARPLPPSLVAEPAQARPPPLANPLQLNASSPQPTTPSQLPRAAATSLPPLLAPTSRQPQPRAPSPPTQQNAASQPLQPAHLSQPPQLTTPSTPLELQLQIQLLQLQNQHLQLQLQHTPGSNGWHSQQHTPPPQAVQPPASPWPAGFTPTQRTPLHVRVQQGAASDKETAWEKATQKYTQTRKYDPTRSKQTTSGGVTYMPDLEDFLDYIRTHTANFNDERAVTALYHCCVESVQERIDTVRSAWTPIQGSLWSAVVSMLQAHAPLPANTISKLRTQLDALSMRDKTYAQFVDEYLTLQNRLQKKTGHPTFVSGAALRDHCLQRISPDLAAQWCLTHSRLSNDNELTFAQFWESLGEVAGAMARAGVRSHLNAMAVEAEPQLNALAADRPRLEMHQHCYACGEQGHFSRECPNRPTVEDEPGRQVCFVCRGVGHRSSECPSRDRLGNRPPFRSGTPGPARNGYGRYNGREGERSRPHSRSRERSFSNGRVDSDFTRRQRDRSEERTGRRSASAERRTQSDDSAPRDEGNARDAGHTPAHRVQFAQAVQIAPTPPATADDTPVIVTSAPMKSWHAIA